MYQEKYKWGVPIIRDVETGTNVYLKVVKRETAAACYRYIEDEFIAARRLLEGREARDGHVNHVAVCGLLTRLYLYQGRWDDVIAAGEETIRAMNGRYYLIPNANYKTTYYKPFNSESIWELSYSVTDNLGSNSLNYLVRKPTHDVPNASNDGQVAQAIGYSAYGLSSNAIDLLNNRSADVRIYLICDLGVSGQSYSGYRKYKGENYYFVHNIPVIRLPEVQLSLAEAYAEKEDWPNAEKYYNPLRLARIGTSGFPDASKEGRLSNILNERRRELMMEGHTYWDYFRRARTLNRQARENISSSSTTIIFGEKTQVVYPIPLDEMEANPHIREQQNPGYAAYVFEN
jgi:hypothetical protein